MNWETVFASAEPLGRREQAEGGPPPRPAGDTAAPGHSSQSSTPLQGQEQPKEEGRHGHPTLPWKSIGGCPVP